MAGIHSSVKTIVAELEYYTGFYQEKSEWGNGLDNNSVHCLARFTPDDCVLRLFAQKKSHPVKMFDETSPHAVFDLGIAELMLSMIQNEAGNDQSCKSDKAYRLVSIKNIPGYGTRSVIFLFPSSKLAKTWIETIKIAQDTIGLGSISYGPDRKLSVSSNHYCEELRDLVSDNPDIAAKVVEGRVKQLEGAIGDKEEMYGNLVNELGNSSNRVEAFREQIKTKQKDTDEIKKKIRENQPQKRYRYIIPFGHPHLDKAEHFIKEETCEQVARLRRESRLVDWRRHDVSKGRLMTSSGVTGAMLLTAAKLENRKYGALKCQ